MKNTNVNSHGICASLVTAGVLMGTAMTLHAGPPVIAPTLAPCSNHCNDPGFYGSISAVYLKSYGDAAWVKPDENYEGGYSDSNEDGDYDWGGRLTLGHEAADGLFFELNGFWWEGGYDFSDDWGDDNEDRDGNIEANYIEIVVGDNLHTGKSCLDYAIGLRYANLDKTQKTTDPDADSPSDRLSKERILDFEGFGPVVRLDWTRRLNDRFSIYASVSQAVLFGEMDNSVERINLDGSSPTWTKDETTDEVAFVTEIEGGVQYDVSEDMYVRLGLESQYWIVDDNKTGLFGGVLSLGFKF